MVAGLIACTFSTNAFAELFSVSAGIPVSHSITSKWSDDSEIETDGVSGVMLHVKFPIMIGVGYESYATKIKSPSSSSFDDIELSTTMYDVFYLTPVPIVNFTIGVGIGSSTLECEDSSGAKCSDNYEAGSIGSSTQFWGQLGFPVFPMLDIHLSYHSVSAKVKGKEVDDLTFNGNMIGLGAAFIF